METSPTSETVFSALAAELESLELEEEELRRQEEESKLRKRIADKRKLIERLRKSGSGDAAGEDNTPRLTIKDLPKVDFRMLRAEPLLTKITFGVFPQSFAGVSRNPRLKRKWKLHLRAKQYSPPWQLS